MAVDNVEVRIAFAAFGTPPDRKELVEYHSEHIVLSDGWLIDEVLGKQIAFLERVLH